ncbi:MAG: ATP-binding cassette domain-containing protein [Defluviitaleaceae bacterium]|nr:ATP-binding cassette domain-containing protein [Defluviitaleaceae bacterium]
MATYKIENLTFIYPNRDNPALQGINLTIESGEFVTLCGPSGCGKTTLLRHLKTSTAPHGIKSGEIYFGDTFLSKGRLADLPARDAASKIGFVFQSPDNQIVTDKVWHELAFGLESLGFKTSEIRLRVAEMASFFGIQTWFHKSVTELSGGQKQLLALASIMAMRPSVLILDEPTSQLDPIAAGEFLATLGKINSELGVTIILTEHRLEEVFPISTRVIVMDNGNIIADDVPQKVGLKLYESNNNMFLAMPTPMRIWSTTQGMACEANTTKASNDKSIDRVPITVRDGAKWLSLQKVDATKIPRYELTNYVKIAINLQNIWFRYEKNLPDIVKDLSFKAHYGEITAILGGNGTGKTTSLNIISGINMPYRGKVHIDTRVYALPQNPQSLFVRKTVHEELLEVLLHKGWLAKKSPELNSIIRLCCLENLLNSHPYDLSGGEQQRAALAKVLLLQPQILLLDEPTKGLDAEYKQIFATILNDLAKAGVAIVMVSHDIEFCAEYAHRISLFFDGNIITENTPKEFFKGNNFYTTAANRMARHMLPEAVTVEDVVLALDGEMPSTFAMLSKRTQFVRTNESTNAQCRSELSSPEKSKKNKTSIIRKPREWIFLALTIILIYGVWNVISDWSNFAVFISGGREAMTIAGQNATVYITSMLTIATGTIGIIFSLYWKREKIIASGKQPLPKRTLMATAIIMFTIPMTIYIGITLFDDRRFYFISMLIILQTMIPFFLVFEGRKPEARELIIIAVLCAIAVAGRSAFFMLPQFKPVVAMVIIAGVAFGGEAGFLVGAMTGFVSNMFFGQGPWTPWQMFAFGLIGFLAGILFRKGLLRRTPISLAFFGGLATFIIYGGIMNPASVIMWQPNPTIQMFIMAYLMGISFDLVHAAATMFFLIIISKPMLEKLDRIKVKYGLVE